MNKFEEIVKRKAQEMKAELEENGYDMGYLTMFFMNGNFFAHNDYRDEDDDEHNRDFKLGQPIDLSVFEDGTICSFGDYEK